MLAAHAVLYWHATNCSVSRNHNKSIWKLCSVFVIPLHLCGSKAVTSSRHFEHRDRLAKYSVSTSLFVQFITQHFKLWNENFLNTNLGGGGGSPVLFRHCITSQTRSNELFEVCGFHTRDLIFCIWMLFAEEKDIDVELSDKQKHSIRVMQLGLPSILIVFHADRSTSFSSYFSDLLSVLVHQCSIIQGVS